MYFLTTVRLIIFTVLLFLFCFGFLLFGVLSSINFNIIFFCYNSFSVSYFKGLLILHLFKFIEIKDSGKKSTSDIGLIGLLLT